jgi:hypothetical protein
MISVLCELMQFYCYENNLKLLSCRYKLIDMRHLIILILIFSSFGAFCQKEVKTDTIPNAEKWEIEASFPGGQNAWVKYITHAITNNIDELSQAGRSGVCYVRFRVDKDGTVSEVFAQSMIGSKLAEIAVNAIKKGPKWNPAIQNGKPVNAYRIQPITFKLAD